MTRFVLILTCASLVGAQPALEFEVATVKLNKAPTGVNGGCHGIDSKYTPGQVSGAAPLGRCVVNSGRLSHLIALAWNIGVGLIRNSPDWAMTGVERYNIEAKAEDPAKTTEAQLYQMLQALLIERFQLKFHRENEDHPGYALVVGKNGPKNLKPSKSQDVATSYNEQMKPMPGQPINLTVKKFTMARLAQELSFTGKPVVDKTGLDGEYDFTLSWDENQGPVLTTAVQEQLGLKLEPMKVPISVFVIESAQKPSSAN